MASATLFHTRDARAIKPTEVGDAAQPLNHDKTQVNKGRFQIAGYPRRGDRCGDRVKGSIPVASSHGRIGLTLKEGSSAVIQPLHLFSITLAIVQEKCRENKAMPKLFLISFWDASVNQKAKVSSNDNRKFAEEYFASHFRIVFAPDAKVVSGWQESDRTRLQRGAVHPDQRKKISRCAAFI